MRITPSIRWLTTSLALFIFATSLYAARGGQDIGLVDITELPAKNKDIFQDVSMKHVKKERAFAIGFIDVKFATQATYKARFGAAIHGGPKAEVTVILDGLSDEFMQAIADTAGAVYERELTAAGFEIVPRSELEANEAYGKIATEAEPRGVETEVPGLFKSSGTTHLKTFTAHDGPAWSGKAAKHLYKLTSKLKKGVVVHSFTIGFSTYKTDKETKYGYDSITNEISIEAVPTITLGAQSTWLASNSKFGMLNAQKVWTANREFLAAGTQREDGAFVMTVDPAVFKEGALALIEKNIQTSIAHVKGLSK